MLTGDPSHVVWRSERCEEHTPDSEAHERGMLDRSADFRPCYQPDIYPSAGLAGVQPDPLPGEPLPLPERPQGWPPNSSRPYALIVDHALRPESAAEAATAAAAAEVWP